MDHNLSVRMRRSDFRRLQEHLHQMDGNEHHAFLLCRRASSSTKTVLLVKEIIMAGDKDVVEATPSYVKLQPPYFLNAVERCRKEGFDIIDVHSHPFATSRVSFSQTDLDSAAHRFAWHAREIPTSISAGLVFGAQSVGGHYWRKSDRTVAPIRQLEVVGDTVEVWNVNHRRAECDDLAFDRQVRLFGSEVQSTLSSLEVGIVGLGGTGSHVAQQLAYLGVRKFTLVDPDIVETTNLNRLIGSRPSDVGRHKVEVAKRTIQQVAPMADVDSIGDDVLGRSVGRLNTCSVVFSCTDNDAARFQVSLLARRYLWLHVDLGSSATTKEGKIVEMGGQVVVAAPDGFNLACSSLLSAKNIDVGRMSKEERNHYQLHYGFKEPAPAVVSLNGVIASLAVQELLRRLTRQQGVRPIVRYNALGVSVESWAAATPCNSTCPRCGSAVTATGDQSSQRDFHPIPKAHLDQQ